MTKFKQTKSKKRPRSLKIQIPFKTCNGGDVEEVSRRRRLSGEVICERRGKLAKLKLANITKL